MAAPKKAPARKKKRAPRQRNGKRGQQPVYTVRLANEICGRLEVGESLNAICRDDGMPHERTVRRWVVEDRDGFAPKYTRARELGLDARADRCINRALRATGLPAHEIMGERLAFDAERWYLSKMAPKRYGERLNMEHSGEIALKYEPVPRAHSPEEFLRIIEQQAVEP